AARRKCDRRERRVGRDVLHELDLVFLQYAELAVVAEEPERAERVRELLDATELFDVLAEPRFAPRRPVGGREHERVVARDPDRALRALDSEETAGGARRDLRPRLGGVLRLEERAELADDERVLLRERKDVAKPVRLRRFPLPKFPPAVR